jgi:hypothetical protein
MAKRNHTRDVPTPEGSSKQERFLTVSLYPEAQPKIPWIRLRGLWLQQAGFTPQSRIRVRVMTDCLVITRE